MKIAEIDVFQVHLPYSGGVYRLSGGREYAGFDATFVRVTTECGIEGWGESTPFGSTYIAAHGAGARAGIAEIAPNLLGKNPRQLDRIIETMDGWLVGHNHAKTPIDVACWDIFGKSVDMPVCDLLGGRTNQALPLIPSIYAGDPEDMRARVQIYREAGYRGHSIKVGSEPMLDAECIKASLADRKPGEYFIVDANGGLTRCRRQRDICIAAGYPMSVQETTGSDIAFAAIVHLGQTVPEKYLRCVLDCRDMVSLKTADGDYVVENGFISAPQSPGLGVTPRMDVLGKAVLSYS